MQIKNVNITKKSAANLIYFCYRTAEGPWSPISALIRSLGRGHALLLRWTLLRRCRTRSTRTACSKKRQRKHCQLGQASRSCKREVCFSKPQRVPSRAAAPRGCAVPAPGHAGEDATRALNSRISLPLEVAALPDPPKLLFVTKTSCRMPLISHSLWVKCWYIHFSYSVFNQLI